MPQWLFVYLHEMETGNISGLSIQKFILRANSGHYILYDKSQPEYSQRIYEMISQFAKRFRHEVKI